MKEFPYFTKLLFAKAFLNYWRVKEHAVSIGRLKSCRRLKVMDLSTLSSPVNNSEVIERVNKIRNTTLKEHHVNLKHILLKNDIVKDADTVRTVYTDYRTGVISLYLSRDFAAKKHVLSSLVGNSNLPLAQMEPHFITNGYQGYFDYRFSGTRKEYFECNHFEDDYTDIHDFLRKVGNTVRLINRTSAKIDDIHGLYYRYREYKFNFAGVSDERSSVEDILGSAFTVTSRNGTRSQRGRKVEAVNQIKIKTKQDIINDFVNSVILPSRGES